MITHELVVSTIDVLGMEMATYHFGEAKVTEDSWRAVLKDNDPNNDDVNGSTIYKIFPQVTKCDGCQLIVLDVKLDIEIILYNKYEKPDPVKPKPGDIVIPSSSYEDYMNRFNKGDDFGNTVLEHEQMHEFYAMEEWNKAANLVNFFGKIGPDLNEKCCQLKSAYLNAHVKYRWAEAEVRHAIFDYLAYGKRINSPGPDSGSNENIIEAKRLSDLYFNDMEAKKRNAAACYN